MKIMLRSKFLTRVFIFLIGITAFSQNAIEHDTLYANYIGQEEGLLQLNVKDLALDNEGFLWAGTEDGLHKFNSYEFKAFLHDPEDNSSIPDDHVRGILHTNDTLWIATNSRGIIGFKPSEMKFFNFQSENNNPNLNTSYKIFNLNVSKIMFALKNHVVIYDRKERTSREIALPKNNKDVSVTSVLPISKDEFWLGSTSNGILKLNLSSNKIEKLEFLQNANDVHLFKHNDLIFAGTKNGLFKISKNLLPELILEEKSIKSFYKLDQKTIFIGLETGLYRFNIETGEFASIVFSDQNNKTLKVFDINKILGDEKGNIWIGTEGDGLIHYNIFQKKFSTLKIKLKEYPNKEDISSFQFLKGRDSTLWIGSKWGIVKYFHKNGNFELYKKPTNALIYTIIEDQTGNIWSGGFTTGLLKYDADTDTFESINNPKLKDNDVINIIPISERKLWVCTWAGGIYEYHIGKNEFEEIEIDGKRINRARTSLIDNEGNIWLGTDEGAYRINKEGETSRYFSKDSIKGTLSGNRIFDIKQDSNNNIWLGTNSGLTKLNLNTGESNRFFKQKGLPNDFI
ncbi:MAG TPA: two-component regulator propeller domain-containing protein, partial [Christiangramia sp.]|nr:two-component regulator propeller domain-containing protein [Christiangramia sp.]